MRRLASIAAATLVIVLAPCLAREAAAQAKAAANKPAQRPAARPGKPAAARPLAKPGQRGKPAKAPPDRNARPGPDDAVRRSIAGGPTADDTQKPAESPELRALREAERELFAPAAPRPGSPWPTETLHPLPLDPDRPVVHAAGVPPALDPREPVEGVVQREPEVAWVQQLKLPDLPVRWDARVVRYLQFFRDDPRGRASAAYGARRIGRYRELIRAALRAERLPESLVWVAMVESGFDPSIKSHAGAAGLWQFMPDGARIYGLRVDRWVDERLDPVMASQAAARYLSDLHRRFGTWELALAAYNMGYGGLLAAIRKYNTNDFWELSRLEAGIPWETTLYVPKIIAFAVVAENPQVFGVANVDPEPALAFATVPAAGALSLATIARVTGARSDELEALNPQLRARRTPPTPDVLAPASAPASNTYPVRLPIAHAAGAEGKLADAARAEPVLARYTVKFGQNLDAIALAVGTQRARLAELNGLTRDDVPRAGDTLLVPHDASPSSTGASERPVVVAPRHPQRIEGRERHFYRVIVGDTLAQIARAFDVSADELRSWNGLDPAARLQEGTTLQVFLPPSADLSRVVALRADDAHVLTVGTDEFFAHFEALKGRHRIAVTVGPNDTWRTIASRHGASIGLLERINRRSHTEQLRPGETLVVYTAKPGGTPPAPHDDDTPGVPALAPHPEDLPDVPAKDVAAPAPQHARPRATRGG